MAAIATFALKAGVWFRRGRLLMVSPDSLGTACPQSGRNSTYRPVQISGTGSFLPTPYSLLPTPYSLLPTHYSLLTTHYSLLTTHYSLLTIRYSLFAIRYSLTAPPDAARRRRSPARC